MEKKVERMVPAAMVSLRDRVRRWRRDKQQRRMPEELWSAAVSLAREFGVHPVSKTVEVSYSRLKKLVDGPLQKTVQFVEVSSGRAVVGVEIEVIRADGCRMYVHNPDAKISAILADTFLKS